jgi:hypothetical protein
VRDRMRTAEAEHGADRRRDPGVAVKAILVLAQPLFALGVADVPLPPLLDESLQLAVGQAELTFDVAELAQELDHVIEIRLSASGHGLQKVCGNSGSERSASAARAQASHILGYGSDGRPSDVTQRSRTLAQKFFEFRPRPSFSESRTMA